MRERQEQFPGVVVEKRYLRDYPHKELGRPAVRHASREISPKRAQGEALPGVAPGTRDRPERPRGAATTSTCAARTATRGSSSTRSATATTSARSSRVEPHAGPAAAADARPRPQRAGDDALKRGDRRPSRQRRARPARTWRWTRATARSSRSAPTRASTPTCSPSRSRRRRYDDADLGGQRRAAVQPRDRVGVSDRLDVQADHGDGGAGGGRDHAEHDDRSTTASSSSATQTYQNAKDASFGALNMSRRAEGLLGRLLLQARRAGQRARARCIQQWAQRLGFGRQTGHRHPGRVRRPGARPRVARHGLRRVPASAPRRRTCTPGHDAGAVRVRRHRAAVDDRRQRQPRRRPGRPAGDAAAARRSPTRRSPTAARSSRPHLGQAIEDGNGVARRRRSARRPGARSRSTRATAQAILDGLHGAASEPRRHLGRRLQGLADAYPVYGKTGTAERQPNPDQSWYACFVADPARADRGRRDRSRRAASVRRLRHPRRA